MKGITLIISTYNWSEALRLCISSILSQTHLPSEIIIADDGSKEDTQKLIEEMSVNSSIPILHIWQEDKGFRKTTIINKAIAKASGEYIIQLDGDMIVAPHFIQDHIEVAEKGYYVGGSKIELNQKITEKCLKEKSFNNCLLYLNVDMIFNSIRSKTIRSFLSKRYGKNINRMQSSNFSFWKEDYLKINGYDEDFVGWGYEDIELAYRLHHTGVKKKFLKIGGVAYHLWHEYFMSPTEANNFLMFKDTVLNKKTFCENGINKYLNQN